MALTQQPGTIRLYDVELTMHPTAELTREQLEQVTFDVEGAILDHGCGDRFGVALSCVFEPASIEISLTVPAVTGKVVNERILQLLETVEKHVEIRMDLGEQNVVGSDAD